VSKAIVAALNQIGRVRFLILYAVTALVGFLALGERRCSQLADKPYNSGVGDGDWPQLGGSPHRNNAPEGRKIPTEWDIKTGKNIKWSVPLGSQSYGKRRCRQWQVYVGTNNGQGILKRYPPGQISSLLFFRESDGHFCGSIPARSF